MTCNELKDGSDKCKAGYKKIQFCGEQAQKDKLGYFWVDTCCIDKANHAELAEAIISMYRWYLNAASVCALFAIGELRLHKFLNFGICHKCAWCQTLSSAHYARSCDGRCTVRSSNSGDPAWYDVSASPTWLIQRLILAFKHESTLGFLQSTPFASHN